MAKKSQPLEKSLNKSAVFHELESAIEQMQILFFDGTAHYFHQRISWECLVNIGREKVPTLCSKR